GLRGAADSRHLRDLVRRDRHLIERLRDLARDDVVAAAPAGRGLQAAIFLDGHPGAIGRRGFGLGRTRRGGHYFFSPAWTPSTPLSAWTGKPPWRGSEGERE